MSPRLDFRPMSIDISPRLCSSFLQCRIYRVMLTFANSSSTYHLAPLSPTLHNLSPRLASAPDEKAKLSSIVVIVREGQGGGEARACAGFIENFRGWVGNFRVLPPSRLFRLTFAHPPLSSRLVDAAAVGVVEACMRQISRRGLFGLVGGLAAWATTKPWKKPAPTPTGPTIVPSGVIRLRNRHSTYMAGVHVVKGDLVHLTQDGIMVHRVTGTTDRIAGVACETVNAGEPVRVLVTGPTELRV